MDSCQHNMLRLRKAPVLVLDLNFPDFTRVDDRIGGENYTLSESVSGNVSDALFFLVIGAISSSISF